MKLSARDFPKGLQSLKPKYNALLVYGPDAGGVHEIANRVQSAILGDAASDPLATTVFAGEKLASDPAALHDEAAQPAFFGGEKLIRVDNATDQGLAAIENAVTADLPCFILICAGALPPRSKLRKLFEGGKKLGAYACYLDEARDIDALISEIIERPGGRVTPDARLYLRSHLGTDRGISRQEIEKLALYAAGESPIKEIGLKDVQAVIGDTAARATDDIAVCAFSGDGPGADIALSRALRADVNGVEIVRAIAGRCQRLLAAAQARETGKSIEDSVKALRPPVFWKDQGAFKATLQRWPNKKLGQLLPLIIATEVDLKSQIGSDTALLGRLVMRIAQAARRT